MSKKLIYISIIIGLFLFPLSVNGATCQLETQSAYTNSETSAVYYITKKCTKRAFKNPEIFFTYFDSWDQVKNTERNVLKNIPTDELGFMPWGFKKEFKSGTLVKTVNDPKVYVLLRNEKCWIKSERVFEALKYKKDWITDVDSRLLDKYKTCNKPIDYTDHHPPGTLIKYPDSENVYVLRKNPNNGKIGKDLIEDRQEFNRLGFRWDRIITIDKKETYPDWDQIKSQEKGGTTSFSLDKKSIVGKNDGTHTIKEGQAVVADNDIGIKLESIRQLDQKQKTKFGENKFWLKFNFYVNNKRITLKPIRFSGVYRASNYNKLYGVNIGYKASRTDIKDGRVEINLSSLGNKTFESCKDLVNSCKQKGINGKFCEQKYCPTESLSNEKKFEDGKFIVVVPDQISNIGDEILSQLKQCHQEVSNQVKVESDLDQVVIRFIFGRGSAKTTNQGIIWPIKQDEVQSVINKWKQRTATSCESNLLAHELTHHFMRNISMDDIFHEGVANLIAQKVKSEKSSNITCKQKGWSGNTSDSHASQIQSQCYKNCLTKCYNSFQEVRINEGENYVWEGKTIQVNNIEPKKFWPGTDKTGSYHGEVKVTIKDNGTKLDEKTMYIGDMYSNHGVNLLPDGIAIQKIVYPDKTEKKEKVRIRFYSQPKANTPNYCSSSCKPVCQQRIEENQIKYNNIDNYLKKPWKPTFKMFYNTSQCLFQKSEQDNPNAVYKVIDSGKQSQNNSQEFCVGTEIEENTSQSTFNNLQNIFNINNECKWKVPRIANIDCWNKSCRPGKVIR